MKIVDPSITILVNAEYTEIELIDRKSSSIFAKIRLTPEQLSSALSRLAWTKCEIDVYNLDRLNKQHENKEFVFEMPPCDYKSQDAIARKTAIKLCPEGWESDGYFGAQGSFFTKDGKDYARVTIRRWV